MRNLSLCKPASREKMHEIIKEDLVFIGVVAPLIILQAIMFTHTMYIIADSQSFALTVLSIFSTNSLGNLLLFATMYYVYKIRIPKIKDVCTGFILREALFLEKHPLLVVSSLIALVIIASAVRVLLSLGVLSIDNLLLALRLTAETPHAYIEIVAYFLGVSSVVVGKEKKEILFIHSLSYGLLLSAGILEALLIFSLTR